MSATKNPITGDSIQTKNISEQYRDNYDAIFRKPVIIELSETNQENQNVQSEKSDS